MQFYEQTLANYNQAAADPKKKNYFDGAATLVLLIVLIVMIYPAIQHIASVNKEIETNKVVDEKLTDKIDALGVAEQNLNKVKDDFALLEKALPTGSDIKNYIKTPIETLAAKHNVVIKSIQFSDVPISVPGTETTLSVRNIDYTLSLSGNFTNLNEFLKDAENFIRVTSTRQLDMKGDSSQQILTIQATTNYLGSPVTVVPNQVQKGASQCPKTLFQS